MKLRFLLHQNMRIMGLPHVFEPGHIYDLDATQVGSLGLLHKVDGFGSRCFEVVKEPAPAAGPTPTPEEIHLDTRERRQAETAQKRKDAVANRKAEAEALARSRATRTPDVPAEEPEDTPQEDTKTQPGKLASRLGRRPK